MPGVTLIEVVVVVTIIALLAVVAMVNVTSALPKARDASRKADLQKISKALEQYYDDRGGYPIQLSTTGAVSASTPVSACGTNTILQTYLKNVPCQPSSNTPYVYDPTGTAYTGSRGDSVFGAYRLLTKLENSSDPIIKETCPRTTGADHCGGSYLVTVGGSPTAINGTTNILNYGLAGGTRVLE